MKKTDHSNTPRPGIVGSKLESVQGDERAGCAISKMNECYLTEKKERKSPPKTYSEKLRDPRWQRKRLEILKRDEWMCQCCLDDAKPLHVHHSIYIKGKEPWEYDSSLLVTLCEDCHMSAEKLKKRVLSALADPFFGDAMEHILNVWGYEGPGVGMSSYCLAFDQNHRVETSSQARAMIGSLKRLVARIEDRIEVLEDKEQRLGEESDR